MWKTADSKSPRLIKIIGVGRGGCNVIKRVLNNPAPGCQYIACHTDITSLRSVTGDILSVQIGEQLTRGFGTGGDARVGEKAAGEASSALKGALRDAQLVFIIAGMGGGTGTGAAPFIARIATEMGAVVVGIVTTPFSFEGKRRFRLALGGISRLSHEVDNLIIIDNDRLLRYADNPTVQEAFSVADEAICDGIMALSDAAMADFETVLGLEGGAVLAIGKADRKSRYPLQEAAKMAIANPLLDIEVSGAKGLVVCFSARPVVPMSECLDALNFISQAVDPDAFVIWGMPPSNEVSDLVKVTLIGTGIHPPLPASWLVEMGEFDGFAGGQSAPEGIAEPSACSVCGRRGVPLEVHPVNIMPTMTAAGVGTATKLANVMMVCRSCHRLIDIESANRSIDDLRQQTRGAYQLERRVVRLLKDAGWAVISGITGPDAGVDIVGHFVEGGTGRQVSLLIQCCWRGLSQVGTGEIVPFAAKVQRYGSQYGVIVSDSEGSEDEMKVAQLFGLSIVTLGEFEQLISELSGRN